MPVDIQATFSAKEKPRNGLENIIDQLVDDPMTPRYIVARIFSPTTKRNNLEGGTETPVVRLDLIEPMLSQQEEEAAKKLLDRAYKARTGNLPEETLLGVKADQDGDGEPLKQDGLFSHNGASED